jgi:hypothetical protein
LTAVRCDFIRLSYDFEVESIYGLNDEVSNFLFVNLLPLLADTVQRLIDGDSVFVCGYFSKSALHFDYYQQIFAP